MQKEIIILILFNSISFLAYGTSCIFAEKAKLEFNRYKMSGLRIHVGLAQVVLALCMLLGLKFQVLVLLTSTVLAGMMVVAIWVRKSLNDTFLMKIPAYIYLLSNAVLSYLVF